MQMIFLFVVYSALEGDGTDNGLRMRVIKTTKTLNHGVWFHIYKVMAHACIIILCL